MRARVVAGDQQGSAPAGDFDRTVPVEEAKARHVDEHDLVGEDQLDRGALLDRRQFLRRSLEDLGRELETGEIEPEDHARLERRDRALLEDTEAALAKLDAAVEAATRDGGPGGSRAVPSATPRQPAGRMRHFASRHRKAVGVAAGGCFAAALAAVGLALGGVAPFTSTTTTTLPVTTRIQTELAEAATLAEDHNVVEAVAVYDDVLALDPRQPEALSEGGWLVRLAGISTHRPSLVAGGDREIAEAVRIAPSLAVPRAYYGVALFEDRHDATASVTQFEAMLRDHPTTVLLRSVARVATRAFRAAGVAVPAQLRPTGRS